MQAHNLHSAVLSHYIAKKSEAIAMIELLYNKSVAIGEHTNILDEVKKWVEVLEVSESCINKLNDLFPPQGAQNE